MKVYKTIDGSRFSKKLTVCLNRFYIEHKKQNKLDQFIIE